MGEKEGGERGYIVCVCVCVRERERKKNGKLQEKVV